MSLPNIRHFDRTVGNAILNSINSLAVDLEKLEPAKDESMDESIEVPAETQERQAALTKIFNGSQSLNVTLNEGEIVTIEVLDVMDEVSAETVKNQAELTKIFKGGQGLFVTLNEGKIPMLSRIKMSIANAFKAIGDCFKAVFNCICCRGTRALEVEECDKPVKQLQNTPAPQDEVMLD